MSGGSWPKLKSRPEEHMGEKVPVVTTSTSRAALVLPRRFTVSTISSAVRTTALPFLMRSLISAMVFSVFAFIAMLPPLPPCSYRRALLVRSGEVVSLGKIIRAAAGRLAPLVRVGLRRRSKGLARTRRVRVDKHSEGRAAAFLPVHTRLVARNIPGRSTRLRTGPLSEQTRSFEHLLKNPPQICGKPTFLRRCSTWPKSLAKAILFPVRRWLYSLGIGRVLR